MRGKAVSRRGDRVGREAYIEYLLLDRIFALRRRTAIADLVAFFQSESAAMTDAELHAALDRLVQVGATVRWGDAVCASEIARYIMSLPEATPEAR